MFWSILRPSQKERGGEGAPILIAGILTVSSQLTTILSILKEINTTKCKDLYLTRWTRKLAICHRCRHSDECIFTMFFKSKYVKLKFLCQRIVYTGAPPRPHPHPPPLSNRQHIVQLPNVIWIWNHEHTISLRFLFIILRVLRLEVSI